MRKRQYKEKNVLFHVQEKKKKINLYNHQTSFLEITLITMRGKTDQENKSIKKGK